MLIVEEKDHFFAIVDNEKKIHGSYHYPKSYGRTNANDQKYYNQSRAEAKIQAEAFKQGMLYAIMHNVKLEK